MTANKSSKAVARAGDGKAAREIPDRSVTSGTEKRHSTGGGSVTLHSLWNVGSVCTVFAVVCYSWKFYVILNSGHSGPPPLWVWWCEARVCLSRTSHCPVYWWEPKLYFTKFLLFCHVYNLSIAYTLYTLRKNSNHSSIKCTVVHLTSAPLDRTTVIVVREACNSCALALFTFEADELKMFCRFLGFAAWSARVWRQPGISF